MPPESFRLPHPLSLCRERAGDGLDAPMDSAARRSGTRRRGCVRTCCRTTLVGVRPILHLTPIPGAGWPRPRMA